MYIYIYHLVRIVTAQLKIEYHPIYNVSPLKQRHLGVSYIIKL